MRNKILNNINRSIDIVVIVNGNPVAGQQNAVLIQQRASIDITNKINPEWQESLSGTRTWNIKCNGLYVIGATALKQLENAFLRDEEIEVLITIDRVQYKGKVLLTDFPLNVVFDSGLKYSVSLLGTGPLVPIEQP